MTEPTRRAEFPEKLGFLFHPHRYKVAYGGRGGTKSWGFARALLILGAARCLRIVCARETQQSIQQSVYQLLVDQIQRLGLQAEYEIQAARIMGRNGSEFIFVGLRHNVNAIKSLEGADIVWVEEAQVVTKGSWDILVPTVRKDGSEIWVSFNPELETDETYKRFVLTPPPGAMVVKIGWRDNPWFPEVLRVELEHERAKDQASYEYIWEGNCRSSITGAIYGAELKRATEDGRICSVPYDRTKPVDTFWDLGFGDTNTIWMAQHYGGWFNFIDYLEGRGQTIADYCVQLQARGYVYGTDWLPHDGVDAMLHGRLTGDRSRSPEQLMRAAGRRVRVAPKLQITSGINAARTILPQCRFDAERCADGLQALRHYQWGELAKTGREARQPLHNWACFHPDTEVLTNRGKRRIIDLDANSQEVLTPCGWKPFQGPILTRRGARLVEVKFTDGSMVRCTPEHLFLTERGWKSAESLRPAMRIRSTLTRSRSISMAVSIVFGRRKDTIRAAAKPYIERYGNRLSALFHQVAISITGIQIHPTMAYQTSNACPRSNTFPKLCEQTQEKSVLLPGRGPQLGIDQKRVGSGIKDKHNVQVSVQNSSARRDLARTVVSKWMRWCASLVTSRNSAPRYANPLHIKNVVNLEQRSDVYCIGVDEGNWFSLSNGAVVHNSHAADGFRTAAVAIKTPTPDRQEKPAPRLEPPRMPGAYVPFA